LRIGWICYLGLGGLHLGGRGACILAGLRAAAGCQEHGKGDQEQKSFVHGFLSLA